MAFDEQRGMAVTVGQARAEVFAREAARFAALPDASQQNPILTFAPHDIVGLVTRLRPFLGQIGTTPSAPIPDSHNAGDFGAFLVGAPHRYAMEADELQQHKTDGHLDVNAARAGAIIVCPVKVPGAGVYVGDMHALQGDGEIAGHTADVSGTVTLQVEALKGLGIDGPVLFPVEEDLPYLAKPLTADEHARATALARAHGLDAIEESLPISVIGTGPDLNSATDNALARAANLLDVTIPEVANRATVSGAIEIGRHPGVVRATFRAPRGPAGRLRSAALRGGAVRANRRRRALHGHRVDGRGRGDHRRRPWHRGHRSLRGLIPHGRPAAKAPSQSRPWPPCPEAARPALARRVSAWCVGPAVGRRGTPRRQRPPTGPATTTGRAGDGAGRSGRCAPIPPADSSESTPVSVTGLSGCSEANDRRWLPQASTRSPAMSRTQCASRASLNRR
jgi:acetamidase/formamidase